MTQAPLSGMDPLQQPVSEAPAVAEPQQQPPVEEKAAEVPVMMERCIQTQPEPRAPTSLNFDEPSNFRDTPRAVFGNGYNSDSNAHYHSRSTDFHHSAPEYTPQDADQAARLTSSPSLNPQPHLPSASRPGSGLSSGPERQSFAQPQVSDVAQRQAAQAAKNSVVIKVGMVGDAQIGKTSLMVKYVEGSWDEDYIQTLGRPGLHCG